MDKKTEAYARQIEYTAEELDRKLASVIRSATSARLRLQGGERIDGDSVGSNPLGHQDPADITRLAMKLDTLLSFARGYGLTEEQILEARTVKDRPY